jgi:hypothetical protein
MNQQQAWLAQQAAQRNAWLSQQKARSTSNQAVLAVLAVGALLLTAAIVSGLAASQGSGNSKRAASAPHQHDHSDAWGMARTYVEERLKAPGTADFGWQHSRDVCKKKASLTWECSGWVDSQNSFGAEVRTHFRAVVKANSSSSEDWELVSLEMN